MSTTCKKGHCWSGILYRMEEENDCLINSTWWNDVMGDGLAPMPAAVACVSKSAAAAAADAASPLLLKMLYPASTSAATPDSDGRVPIECYAVDLLHVRM